MKGDWIVLGHTDCLDNLPVVQQCLSDEYTLDGVYAVDLIDSTDVASKEDSLTIVRMVGELSTIIRPVGVPGPTTGRDLIGSWTLQFDEHICVTTTDDQGGVALLDPRRELTMESDTLLWRRRKHVIFNLQAKAGGLSMVGWDWDTQEFASPHLDLRVKRRIRQGMVLVYAQGATVVDLAGDYTLSDALNTFTLGVSFNLRGYVKF